MARSLSQSGTDRQNRMILVGAVALALLAAVLVFASLNTFGGDDGGSSVLGATQDVVVAAQDIKAGTKITNDMVAISTFPKNAVIADVISDKAVVVGLTARYPLTAGDQISPIKLGQTESNRTFSDVIPEGKRAVSVDVVEKTSVGGLIIAGDHVDVIVIGKSTAASGGQDVPVSFTLLQDVEVLSVAQTTQEPVARLDKDGNPIQTDTAAGSISTRPDDTDANPKAKSVTLAVSPEDAARLALAGQSYSIYLSLRGTGDDSKINNPNDLQILPDLR